MSQFSLQRRNSISDVVIQFTTSQFTYDRNLLLKLKRVQHNWKYIINNNWKYFQ